MDGLNQHLQCLLQILCCVDLQGELVEGRHILSNAVVDPGHHHRQANQPGLASDVYLGRRLV